MRILVVVFLQFSLLSFLFTSIHAKAFGRSRYCRTTNSAILRDQWQDLVGHRLRGGGSSIENTATSISRETPNPTLIDRIRSWIPRQQRQQQQSSEKTPQNLSTKSANINTNNNPYDPLRLYVSCMGIVLIWVTTGTLFYSYCNQWPLAQSFFYAVDAGMSIGFCTQVYETKLISKAFTIIYILLGASVIGGALALFLQDALEGMSAPAVEEYQVLLERDIFDKADLDKTGVLTFEQFQTLIQSSTTSDGIQISPEDIRQLWSKFDKLRDGVIHFEEFVGTYRGIHRLVQSLQRQNQQKRNPILQMIFHTKMWLQQAWQLEYRIYFVFALWISVGIAWGILNQGWDPITATHFAVSALATGGLTAPDVNADGILPAEAAIFCGVFCLFGIPLFALTLGHFARVLVADQAAAMERNALTRPITNAEYELAAHLTTRDSVIHLSDFIVLQLLRQGKLSVEAIQVLKHNFELLDTDRSGVLTLEKATTPPPQHILTHRRATTTTTTSTGK